MKKIIGFIVATACTMTFDGCIVVRDINSEWQTTKKDKDVSHAPGAETYYEEWKSDFVTIDSGRRTAYGFFPGGAAVLFQDNFVAVGGEKDYGIVGNGAFWMLGTAYLNVWLGIPTLGGMIAMCNPVYRESDSLRNVSGFALFGRHDWNNGVQRTVGEQRRANVIKRKVHYERNLNVQPYIMNDGTKFYFEFPGMNEVVSEVSAGRKILVMFEDGKQIARVFSPFEYDSSLIAYEDIFKVDDVRLNELVKIQQAFRKLRKKAEGVQQGKEYVDASDDTKSRFKELVTKINQELARADFRPETDYKGVESIFSEIQNKIVQEHANAEDERAQKEAARIESVRKEIDAMLQMHKYEDALSLCTKEEKEAKNAHKDFQSWTGLKAKIIRQGELHIIEMRSKQADELKQAGKWDDLLKLAKSELARMRKGHQSEDDQLWCDLKIMAENEILSLKEQEEKRRREKEESEKRAAEEKERLRKQGVEIVGNFEPCNDGVERNLKGLFGVDFGSVCKVKEGLGKEGDFLKIHFNPERKFHDFDEYECGLCPTSRKVCWIIASADRLEPSCYNSIQCEKSDVVDAIKARFRIKEAPWWKELYSKNALHLDFSYQTNFVIGDQEIIVGIEGGAWARRSRIKIMASDVRLIEQAEMEARDLRVLKADLDAL